MDGGALVNEGGSHDTSGKVDGIGRPLRSWLFTPASRPDRFGKAAEVGADVLVLDLEDAVAPADKEQARATAIGYLGRPSSGAVLRALRINGLDTRAGLADLHALLASSAAPDLLVLPKTDSAAHLQILDRLLTAARKNVRLVGLVESARGLLAVQETAAATPRLAALMFGAADMAADLGATVAWEPLVSARCQLIAACARCGVLPIDSPFFDIHDKGGLSSEITRSHALGFASKAAIHPSQIGPINAALSPTPEAIAKARAILAENGKGVGVVDGQMVDEAIARQARRTLAAAGLRA